MFLLVILQNNKKMHGTCINIVVPSLTTASIVVAVCSTCCKTKSLCNLATTIVPVFHIIQREVFSLKSVNWSSILMKVRHVFGDVGTEFINTNMMK